MARDLGVSKQALRGWIKRAEVDAGHGGRGEPTAAEQGELRRLRRLVKVLQQERKPMPMRSGISPFARP